MEFWVKCKKDYTTDKGETLFKKGDTHKLVIGADCKAKVMYSSNSGTYFYGNTLKEHFEKKE